MNVLASRFAGLTRSRRANGASLLLDLGFIAGALGDIAAYAVVHARFRNLATIPLPVFVVALAVLTAVWWWLPWERDAGRGARACSVVFGLAVLPCGFDAAGQLVLLALAVTNAGLVFGVLGGALEALLALAAAALAYWHADASLVVSAYLLTAGATFYAALIAAADNFHRRREDQRTSHRLLVELEARNQQLEVARADLERAAQRVRELTVAAERGRFARDMHDAVGHHLVAATLSMRHAGRLRGEDPAGAWAEIDAASAEVQVALEETRRTVHGMRPHAIADHLDRTALASLTDGFSSAMLAIELTVNGDVEALPPDVGLVVYRTVQEGMTNLVKHSDADRAQVRVTVQPGDGVRVEVEDNGSRCSRPWLVGDADGIGLVGLRERAEEHGGALDAGPGPAGFLLRVHLPSPTTVVDGGG